MYFKPFGRISKVTTRSKAKKQVFFNRSRDWNVRRALGNLIPVHSTA
jgi:hypothetical protein